MDNYFLVHRGVCGEKYHAAVHLLCDHVSAEFVVARSAYFTVATTMIIGRRFAVYFSLRQQR